MNEEAQKDWIGQVTQEAWKQWEQSGFLEALQKEWGALNEKELVIFHDAWKLGFAHSMEIGRQMAMALGTEPPAAGRN